MEYNKQTDVEFMYMYIFSKYVVYIFISGQDIIIQIHYLFPFLYLSFVFRDIILLFMLIRNILSTQSNRKNTTLRITNISSCHSSFNFE